MPDGELKTVLIVDDEEGIRLVAKRALEKTGLSVFAVANASEALDFLRANKVDLVLTDILMPGIDGLQLISQAREIVSDVCWLVMTAYVDLETVSERIKNTSFDYISKPFDINRLRERVQEAYSRQKTRQAEATELMKARLAHEDLLTGLQGPRPFLGTLEQALQEGYFPLTLVYLDINGLRQINEKHGAEVGDQVLVKVASILQQAFPPPMQVCRYGADEFMLLLRGVSKAQAKERLERLMKEFPQHLSRSTPQAQRVDFFLSIGIASAPEDGEKSYILLGAAQDALKKAKGS